MGQLGTEAVCILQVLCRNLSQTSLVSSLFFSFLPGEYRNHNRVHPHPFQFTMHDLPFILFNVKWTRLLIQRHWSNLFIWLACASAPDLIYPRASPDLVHCSRHHVTIDLLRFGGHIDIWDEFSFHDIILVSTSLSLVSHRFPSSLYCASIHSAHDYCTLLITSWLYSASYLSKLDIIFSASRYTLLGSRMWGSHSGSYEKFYLWGYNAL
jgi:hypothetical protein